MGETALLTSTHPSSASLYHSHASGKSFLIVGSIPPAPPPAPRAGDANAIASGTAQAGRKGTSVRFKQLLNRFMQCWSLQSIFHQHEVQTLVKLYDQLEQNQNSKVTRCECLLLMVVNPQIIIILNPLARWSKPVTQWTNLRLVIESHIQDSGNCVRTDSVSFIPDETSASEAE